MVIAGKLRHVTVAYAAKGPLLKSCGVRTGSDARVIDQMMCSLVASCLPDNWEGRSRMARCVNARVDALEDGIGSRIGPAGRSPFPDEWLAAGVEAVHSPAVEDDAPPARLLAAAKPGQWVFTEMAVGTIDADQTGPSLLRWRKCIRPDQAANGLATLLEPPPYTSGVRFSLPDACRDWKLKLRGSTVAGAMACRTPAGASATGKLSGEVSDSRVTFRRERTWRKQGRWAQASFDTQAQYEGACGDAAQS